MIRALLPVLCILWVGFKAELSTRPDAAITLESKADAIAYDNDFILTLTTETPAGKILTLPDLRDRFSGFSLAEDFSGDRIIAGDRARKTYRWRLVPAAAPQWRLAPFAATLKDAATGIEEEFATQAVIFPPPPPRETVTGAPEGEFKPFWIRPTLGAILLWIAAGIGGIITVIGLLFLFLHFRNRVKEMQMSPRDRALVELNRLLGKQLAERGFYKAFYSELTLVVRHYIERAYSIRASRQTTQEFLSAATGDTRFTKDTVGRLAEFLNAADMIKFAGLKTTPELAADAAQKARTYIQEDKPENQSPQCL